MEKNAPPQISDKELSARITSDLLQVPDELRQAEATSAKLANELGQWKAALKDAETDALINCAPGKNDDERKKNLAAAIAGSAAVKTARAKIGELEVAIAAAEVDKSYLRHRWQASIALAELQAARLNMMCKLQTAHNLTSH